MSPRAQDHTPMQIGDELDWLNGLIDRARNNAEHLSDGQISFIDSMLLRVERFKERTFFSPRQRRFARTIEAALDHAGVSREPDDWEE